MPAQGSVMSPSRMVHFCFSHATTLASPNLVRSGSKGSLGATLSKKRLVASFELPRRTMTYTWSSSSP